jgi:Concanavalin A-like lectin/glucanases superfamily
MTQKKNTENSKGNQKTPSRREFLQYAGLAAGGGTLLAATPALLSEGVVKGAVAAAVPDAPIPAHRSIFVDGIHAYADQLSVKPGADINFHVSSDTPYTFQIYRLGTDPDTPGSDVSMSGALKVDTPSQQPIHPGSYVHVENGLAATANLTALTLECWVRPFVGSPSYPDPLNYTGVITQFDLQKGAGYGLFVRFSFDGSKGSVAFYLGNGAPFDPKNPNLLEVDMDFLDGAQNWSQLQWHHIVATWDGKTKALWIDGGIDGKPQLTQTFAGPVRPGPAPVRLAACGENGNASRFLNGDLVMPVIYNRALSPTEIQGRLVQLGLKPPALNGVLACWPLSEEQGDDVADISKNKRPGRIINHATWMIGGPNFNADVAQFGDYDPTTDATRGHGLRFASDDLFDCRWQITQTYTVPNNARSGIYVARLTNDAGQLSHVTFIVQKSDKQKPAPILLVCPTNTWLAYNSRPFLNKSAAFVTDQSTPVSLYQMGSLFKETYVSTGRRDVTVPVEEAKYLDFPEYSCYQGHQNFAPGYYFGLLLPNPAADPYVSYGSNNYSHLTRATRFTQAWLERNGYLYDVIGDLDLHTTPDILTKYKTVIVAGHSEYWSIPAYKGLKSYLSSNGRLIVLSGNTMYWRVSFSPDGTVMECRKVDGAGGLVNPSRRGEAWHSDDGLRGGLMRECGFPGWQLTGLETFGILNVGGGSPATPLAATAGDLAFGTFYVANPNHFLLQGVGVTDNQAFAQYTVGHESDIRVATLEDIRAKAGNPLPPPGAAVPVEPPGITTLAVGHNASICCYPFDYFLDNVNVDPVAELIYWQRPDGGRVFNGGSIANGVALYYDDKNGNNDHVFAKLMTNVLTYFLGP